MDNDASYDTIEECARNFTPSQQVKTLQNTKGIGNKIPDKESVFQGTCTTTNCYTSPIHRRILNS